MYSTLGNVRRSRFDQFVNEDEVDGLTARNYESSEVSNEEKSVTWMKVNICDGCRQKEIQMARS